MARKRAASGIPREWSPYTAETIEKEFQRVYRLFDEASPAAAGLTGLTPHPSDLIVGDQTGSGGWKTLPLVGPAQPVLGNDGAVPAWVQVDLTKGVTGALPVANAGTNLTTYAQGDLLYASAANVLAKLAKDANATRYLSNTGTTNNPAWAQIDLSNGVTGTLADSHLSANIPLLNGAAQNFTGKLGINVVPSASRFAVVGLPTSSAGLATGDVWCDTTGALNILKIV